MGNQQIKINNITNKIRDLLMSKNGWSISKETEKQIKDIIESELDTLV